jgi:hypothetical protein
MDAENFTEPAVVVAVAATAAVLSPPVRRVLRRGAVYGVAGVMVAGDAISSFAKGAARGVRNGADAADGGAEAEPGTPAPAGGEAG